MGARYACRVALKTSPSPDLRRRSALLTTTLLVLVVAGCGGGEVAGQSATQSSPSQTTASVPATTATTPPVTTTQPRHRPRTTTAPPTTTTTTTRTTTQPPAATTTTTTPATTTATTTTATPAGTAIDETANLRLVTKIAPGHYTQSGAVTGTYDGTMTLEAKITNRGVVVNFVASLPGGTVSGSGLALVTITGAALEPLAGTASITRGTGKFAGAHGRGLKVKGRAALDGSRGIVRLVGTVTF